MTLDSNCVHFIYGKTLYAVHEVTGQPYVTNCELINGERKVFYTEVDYDRLPDQVKHWWRSYRRHVGAPVLYPEGSEVAAD